jgi:two-component system sensor histidine kinase GlrK
VNVRTKLRGAFATYIALLAGLSVYHVRTNRRAVTTGRELADIAARLRTTSTTQLDRLTQVSNDAQKYAITRDTGYLVKLQQTMGDYDAELRHLSSLRLDPRERDRLTPLSSAWREAMTLASQLGTVPYNSVDAAVDSLHSSLDRVHERTQAVGAASQDVMTHELVDSENAARAAEQVTLVAAGAAVILSILLSALIARSILDPLGLLTEGTREVSAGRFNHRLTPSGNDELAQVAREFNAMTERLDVLDRIKSEFVSKVSHDLKTPLSSMQETNAVLLDEVPGPLTPKQRQLLDINQDSAQRLSGMLGKLLDLSRLEAGLAGERRLTDVRALMRRSVERVAHSALGDHVVLPVDESPSHLLVDADADALLQVFDNLLENAIKFLPHDGKVRIHIADLTARGGVPPERWATLRRTDAIGAVLVSVADEGPGIPDHEKEKVFARFYQAEAGRAVRRRGVGLGLSISREIVTDHGGAIWVSDNEPRGSVFQVLLPAKAWGDVKGGMLFPTASVSGDKALGA